MAAVVAILGVIVTIYAGLGLTLFFMQSRLLYMPSRQINSTPGQFGLVYEKISLQTVDNETLEAWYIPAEMARYTVLFCHGNAGNIGHRIASIGVFHDLGLNVMVFDYRGYGNSTGKPTEEGTILDAQAAYDWLRLQKKIDSGQIILFGRSLGGAVAAQLAGRLDGEQIAGLILESTFTSFNDMGYHLYPFMPVKLFSRFGYNTLKQVPAIVCPKLIIHSSDDEMVPFEMGQKVFEAAAEPKRFESIEGDHNNGFFDSGQHYKGILRDWLDSLERPANRFQSELSA